MPVTVVCEQCGKAYTAPDALAGRRVRCRGCGNILTISASGPADEADQGPNLDALAHMERSFSGADAMVATRAGTRLGEPHDEPQITLPTGMEAEQLSGEGIEAAARANLRFNFAGSKELDMSLPYILTAVCSLWLIVLSGKTNPSGKAWITLTTIIAWMGAFAGLVWPVAFVGLRAAGRKVGFQLPRTSRWRAFAIYLIPFVLTATLWMMGHGAVASVAVGAIGGLLVGAIFLWFLFRLRPEELPPTVGLGAAGYLSGLLLAGGVMFGVNALLKGVVDSTNAVAAVPSSPLGPNFAWVAGGPRTGPAGPGGVRTRVPTIGTQDPSEVITVKEPEAPKGPPRVTQQLAVAGSEASVGAIEAGLPSGPVVDLGPQVPRPKSAMVVEFVPASTIREPFDRWVFPITPSHYLAGMRREGETVHLAWWDSRNWTLRGRVSFRSLGEDRYALSPDGKYVARIASAPGLAVELWSAGTRVPERIPLDTSLGNPTLLGFVSDDRILIRWDGVSAGLELLDATLKRRIRGLNIPPTDHPESTIAVSPTGKFIAVITRDPDDRRPELRVYASQGESDRAAQRIKINSLDPKFVVAPTGLAFLPDAEKREDQVVAVMFEPQGTAMIAAYRLQGGLMGGELIDSGGKLLCPTGGFGGSSVQWIGAGKSRLLLAYGKSVVSPTKGAIVDEIDTGDISAGNSCDDDTVILIHGRGAAAVPVRVRFDVSKAPTTP